jgi:hypothetical protein
MALSKQVAREALMRFCGLWNPVVTTTAGASDGTTFISTDYSGYGADTHEAMWATPRTGTHAGLYRQINSFSGTTFTVVRAYGAAAVATGLTVEISAIRPDLYTEALNRAIVDAWPHLYLAGLDSSTTLTTGDLTYSLPSGVTPEMIARVATEGATGTPWEGRPRYERDDWECTPDNATLWLGARATSRYQDVETGKKLYLFLHKYLTKFDADSTFGTLATDTTDKIELTAGTDAWDLYLMYARACLYELIAAAPMTQGRGEYLAMAQNFRQMAVAATPAKRMRSLTYSLPSY